MLASNNSFIVHEKYARNDFEVLLCFFPLWNIRIATFFCKSLKSPQFNGAFHVLDRLTLHVQTSSSKWTFKSTAHSFINYFISLGLGCGLSLCGENVE
jgi:hypothetical protein